MVSPPNVAYEFNGFRINPVRRLLFDADGQPIHLNPKTFDTLLYLVEHPYELIDRGTLLKAIWPNVVVEENSLNQVISTLRRELGEHPSDHRFIITEPGHGYRFVATINRIDSENDSASAESVEGDRGSIPSQGPWTILAIKRRWIFLAIPLAIVALFAISTLVIRDDRDRYSIAVLPIENLNTDEKNDFYARAIRDDLVTQLAKIAALKVISRSSVTQYWESSRNVQAIGRELGAENILEGTVRLDSGILQLNIQLVDTDTEELLWSESYHREPTAQNLFAIRADVAENVADMLGIPLSHTELQQIVSQPTQSISAYEYYVSGREYARGRDLLRDLPAAVQQFERAVAKDPEFALAFAQLAIENIHMYWTMDHTDSRRDKALKAVTRALELEPNLPEAHLAMAWYHYQGHLNYEAALKEMEIAERSLPANADLHFARGVIYRRMGQWHDAVTAIGQAVEIDPRNTVMLRNLASTYLMLRDYNNAEKHLDKILEIAPDAVEAKREKAAIPFLRDGDWTASQKVTENNPLLRPGQKILSMWSIAIVERDYDAAIRWLAQFDGDILADRRTLYKLKDAAKGVTYRLNGNTELSEKHFDIARTKLQALMEDDPEQPRYLISLGEALVGLGQTDAGVRLALRAIELMPTSQESMDGPAYQLGAVIRVLAPAGDVELVISQLDAYLSAPGFWSIEGILTDPRLDSVRDDPRFQLLVDKHRRR